MLGDGGGVRCDPHDAARRAAVVGDVLGDQGGLLQQVARMGMKPVSGRSERHALVGALAQGGTEGLLQGFQPRADGWQRQPDRICRGGRLARFRDRAIDGVFGIPQTDAPGALLEEGEDVTKEFITRPPGFPGQSRGLLAIANNRLVATIVGGVFLASIVTYFKLKT